MQQVELPDDEDQGGEGAQAAHARADPLHHLQPGRDPVRLHLRRRGRQQIPAHRTDHQAGPEEQ